MRELSMAEQRYEAVLPVTEDGLSVTEAVAKAGVMRLTACLAPLRAVAASASIASAPP